MGSMTELNKISVRSPASSANLGAGYDCLALALDGWNDYDLYIDPRHLGTLSNGTLEDEYVFSLEGTYANAIDSMRSASGNLFVQAVEMTLDRLSNMSASRDKDKIVVLDRYAMMPKYVEQQVEIPPQRGLGSSASAAVAGVITATYVYELIHPKKGAAKIAKDGKHLTMADVRKDSNFCASLAMHADMCPDNVCASLSGGLTYAMLRETYKTYTCDGGWLNFYRQDIKHGEDFRVVALIPSQKIETDTARGTVNSETVDHVHARFNLCRAAVIPAIFRDRDYKQLKQALRDKLHQDRRAADLYRGIGPDKKSSSRSINLNAIFERVIQAGAYGACISGAGSTLIAFVKNEAELINEVERVFRTEFELRARSVPGWGNAHVTVFEASNKGCECVLPGTTPTPADQTPTAVQSWLKQSPDRKPFDKGGGGRNPLYK